MDITARVGSMSTSTDVIYTHKKFKRAAVEAWESNEAKRNVTEKKLDPKDQQSINSTLASNGKSSESIPVNKSSSSEKQEIKSRHVCERCGFVNSNYTKFEQHNCVYVGITEKPITCRTCKQIFNSNIVYMNHDCFKLNLSPRKNEKVKERYKIPESSHSSSSRVPLNRSFSYPYSAEGSKERIVSGSTPKVVNKQIYKPKFRAQYSFQEELFSSRPKAAPNNQTSQQSLHLRNSNKDTQHLSFSTNVQSLPSTYHSLAGSTVLENAQDIHNVVTSSCSSIWKGLKGIKSPSPELVNQHITNLIVQNQAIVDTHNPLWSIKYRRQSSSGSTSGEFHDNNHHGGKTSRKSSTNNAIKGSRTRGSFSSVSRESPEFSFSTAVSDIPVKSFHHSRSVSPSRASKLNISNPNSRSKVKIIDVYSPSIHIDGKLRDEAYADSHNKFFQNNTRVTVSVVPNEGNNVIPNEGKQSYASVSAQYSGDKSKITKANVISGNVPVHHSKESFMFIQPKTNATGMIYQPEYNLSAPRERIVHEPIHKQLCEEDALYSNRRLSISPSILQNHDRAVVHSPPTKRRKLSVSETGVQMNGKISQRLDFGPTGAMLEDLNKPRNNSNHIYGGEVKICSSNGREFKTYRIDSNNSESPSLNLCIAAKHLADDSDSKEPMSIPTSVVVTIATSGLNCGGTMVDNSTKRKTPLTVDVSPNSKTSSRHHSPMISYSPKVQPGTSNISYSPKVQSGTSNSMEESNGKQRSEMPRHLSQIGSKRSSLPSPIKTVPIIVDTEKNSSDQFHSNLLQFPSIISVGDERVPYVPGIPGPYSPARRIVKYPSKLPDQPPNLHMNENEARSSTGCAVSTSNSIISRFTNTASLVGVSSLAVPKLLSLPEITIQPPAIEIINLPRKSEEDDQHFLIPRKRPNTLLIKPQSLSSKSSLSLIGSTLVSPDTPRPKKSCAQLFLNGSAYTYLNLKVSTKTFFCCIYRPQPMYVLQSTDPKLSMYSNWQIRKTENPLNLTPSEAMSLHISGQYYNRAYTISKPKVVELKVTQSSNWTSKNNEEKKNKSTTDLGASPTEEETAARLFQNNCDQQLATVEKRTIYLDESDDAATKRVKIFEGGFKTNENYIYIRGRGRGRFVCETCGIRCKKPSMLKKHIRTHTDLRPFACTHCSFSFKTKGNLSKHLKSKAHFKKCSEMGIIPVPVMVDDSHINKEALQLQEMNSKMSEEEDDEDDEDDDMDDEDDLLYVDDEDRFQKISGDVQELEEEEENFLDLTSSKNDDETVGLDLSVPKNSSSVATEESLPMDLSIKRPSVIRMSEETPLHIKETHPHSNHSRPNYLPLDKEDENRFSKSYKTMTFQLPSVAMIKERPSDILSPVTESSVILKSIYNSTSSLDDRRHLSPDPVAYDSGSSSVNMLQNYLKERAVLESARKRHQYLLSPSSDHQSCDNPTSTFKMGSFNDTLTATDACSGSKKHQIMNNWLSSNLHHSSSVIMSMSKLKDGQGLTNRQPQSAPCSSIDPLRPRLACDPSKLNLNSSTTTKVPEQKSSNVSSATIDKETSQSVSAAANNKQEAIPQISSVKNNLKIYSPIPTTSSFSTKNDRRTSVVTVSTATTMSIVSSNSTTYIMAENVSLKSASSSTSLKGKLRASGNNLASSSDSSIPTPPANLTVVNTCEKDSKPAFIAPGGVIPSSGVGMRADDGRCRCSICHKEFSKVAQLRLHMNIHFFERPHRCESCGISFRTNGHLQKHKRSVSHFNKMNMNQTFGTPSTENPRPFKCHDCKIAFRIHGHLAKHLRCKLHIMKLECLGKLPFGTYAEIERSGVNLNEIDTLDCENSLESLQKMASRLYEKEPAKLVAWRIHQKSQQQQSEGANLNRVRTISNSSTNSDDYAILDEQESTLTPKYNDEDDSGDEDDPSEGLDASSDSSVSKSDLPPCEIGSGATEGLLGCPHCHEKFVDVKLFESHYYKKHKPMKNTCDG